MIISVEDKQAENGILSLTQLTKRNWLDSEVMKLHNNLVSMIFCRAIGWLKDAIHKTRLGMRGHFLSNENKYRMNKFCLKLALLLSALVSSIAHGENCDELLKGSLYSFTKMTNTGSFTKDLRTYYLSDQFKSDLKSGKWGGSVTIPVEGVPISLGIDFTEDKYQEFRVKILQVTELNISEDFYQTSFSTIPNVNLYEAYVECIRIKDDVSKTGFIQGKNVETEDVVVFTIYYRPQAPTDPMPKVEAFDVQPENSIISGALRVGERLTSFSVSVIVKRDPERDLILTLKTDRGSFVSKSAAEGVFSSSKELPIGTIIASVLNFEQFSFASKNNEKSPGGIWTSAKSRWAPCDGRPLTHSKFSKIANQPNAPDFRGIFLRGLNSFDPAYTVLPSNKGQLNPEDTAPGIYQSDMLKEHNHQMKTSAGNVGGPPPAWWLANNTTDHSTGQSFFTGNAGGNETRPKNISVFYYLKIN